MSLNRDPGTGVTDLLQQARRRSRLVAFGFIAVASCAIFVVQAAEAGRRLIAGQTGEALSPLVTAVLAVAVCGLCLLLLRVQLGRASRPVRDPEAG